jgi:phytoene synthase
MPAAQLCSSGEPAVNALEQSYRCCTSISRRHGSSYYWSTKLLPRVKQPHVHALYALARTADDIVDLPHLHGRHPVDVLADFAGRFFDELDAGHSNDRMLMAVIDTAVRFELAPDPFRRFFAAMEMDLTVASYATWGELLMYMDGSAAVIGEMMLPILGPGDPVAARGPARDLGLAFQLTNFLRDVDEDLDRGRQYLPQDDLLRFDVDLTERRRSSEFVALMRFEIDRCRELYRSAEVGIDMLPHRSAQCIRAAHTVYARILDEIERLDYDVFARRARVPTSAKLALTARQLVS